MVKKSSLFVIVFFVAAIAVLSYFAYPIIKNRYFKSEDKKTEDQNSAEKNLNGATSADEEDKILKEEESEEFQEGSLLNVTREDCEDECETYEEADDLKYCQQVCGLNKAQDNQKSDCESLSGVEKDYCLKNQAIDQNSLSICEKISDKKIKKTCQNRIAEDLLDKSSLSD